MKNLAGNPDCDNDILPELQEAGIPPIKVDKDSHPEVKSEYNGSLHGWRFYRAWYYWVAAPEDIHNGLPLDYAEKLHEGFGGDVRVAGHCGAPPPGERANHFTLDGKQVVVDPEGKEQAGFDSFISSGLLDSSLKDQYVFVNHLDDVEHYSVITCYHIDTQEGLNAFVETLNEWKQS